VFSGERMSSPSRRPSRASVDAFRLRPSRFGAAIAAIAVIDATAGLPSVVFRSFAGDGRVGWQSSALAALRSSAQCIRQITPRFANIACFTRFEACFLK